MRKIAGLTALLLAALLNPAWAQDPRARAAMAAALDDASCRAIQPFYWEIGDAQGVRIGGGSPREQSDYQRDSEMPIASASKWWYGAYVSQRRGGALNDDDLAALRMLSGHHSQSPLSCVFLLPARRARETVGSCQQHDDNARLTPGDRGRFFYNGGHFQWHAAQIMGLGGDNSAQLAQEMNRVLGTELNIRYGSPQLAGGGASSVADYSLFLRKLLKGELRLSALLGSQAVCTQADAQCHSAMSTPLPDGMHWHYSLAHWVEDDPQTGDGAYSSPGAFGFYPWIDHDKRYYGILARRDRARDAYVQSVRCGQKIRRAYLDAPAS